MKNKLELLYKFFCAGLLSLIAQTANGTGCDGKIIELGIFANSSVVWTILDTQQKPWNLCSLTDVMNNGGVDVKPEVCKSVYALLLAAKTASQTVHVELTDAKICATINSWSSLPFYNVTIR